MTLREFVTDPDTGQIKRGALARVAEHIGVKRQTVHQWLQGRWLPDKIYLPKIRQMIEDGIDLTARCSPGRPRKKR